MFSAGIVENTREDVEHDDATEAVIAQARTWIKQAGPFEKLGRNEGRLSREMLCYSRELDRVQTLRKSQVVPEVTESKPDNTKLALVRKQSPPASPFHQKTVVSVAPIIENAPVAVIEVDSPPGKTSRLSKWSGLIPSIPGH